MSDWRNWQRGDLIRFIKGSDSHWTKGRLYRVDGLRPGSANPVAVTEDDEGDANAYRPEYFEWHSRPGA